jgi:hypothetical protein
LLLENIPFVRWRSPDHHAKKAAIAKILPAQIVNILEGKMTIRIKLMTDYCAYPLWGLDPENIGDINPESLPLSWSTLKRLEVWSNTYNNILNWDDPASSTFPSQESLEEFEQDGISLWLQLREELAPEYEVFYKSQLHKQLFTNPQELQINQALYPMIKPAFAVNYT